MTPQPDTEKALHGQGIDPYLQSLVTKVDADYFEIWITVYIPGFIVTRNLISDWKYYEKMADKIYSSAPASIKEEMYEDFISYKTLSEQKQNYNNKEPQFLHLENPVFYYGNAARGSSSNLLWRCKINAVSAFNTGMFQLEND